MNSLFPWNEKLLVVTCVKTFSIFIRGSHVANFGHTACYRHSTLTAPETLPGAYWDSVLHRKARQNITDYGTQQTKRFNLFNVITGEEVSNTDPQLTVLHLNPINKRFCRRQIDPLHIYSIYDKKNLMYFPPVVPSAARVRFQNRGVGAQQKCCTPKSLNCWMPVTNLPTCYASIESWGLSGLNVIRITSVSAPERISWTI